MIFGGNLERIRGKVALLKLLPCKPLAEVSLKKPSCGMDLLALDGHRRSTGFENYDIASVEWDRFAHCGKYRIIKPM